ncbi:hypothetical protein GCM10008986_13240 [Salinibacillus aidingensis]|uniref:Uncharacterized protein n=1 Tax=Salinibacillus aidingensis TaxID=237684 RepID=A0ABP3KY66_9BACI
MYRNQYDGSPVHSFVYDYSYPNAAFRQQVTTQQVLQSSVLSIVSYIHNFSRQA